MIESVEQFFAGLPEAIDPVKTAGINATYEFVVTGEGGGEWHVRLANGRPQVVAGRAESPDITLTVSADDWLRIVNRETSGPTAFLTGKLKIEGDVALAIKLQSLLG